MFRPAIVLAAFSMCLGLAQARASAPQAQPLPLFDAHLHYNWEPTPYSPLDNVLALFREHGSTGILATSRPNDGTRALVEAPPSDIRVVPFIRPYIVHDDIQTWFDDPKIFQLVQAEFKRGYYQGIGEFHLSGKAAATEWVKRTVNFAVEHGLFLHAHADDEALEILFSHNPKARIIWAHTGFGTPPDKLADYLERYPGLTGELSYRFGISEGGKLTAAWRALFLKYPDRFLVGSDTWADQRWERYGAIMDEYRAWLAELPREVAEQIAFRNAERLFGRTNMF